MAGNRLNNLAIGIRMVIVLIFGAIGSSLMTSCSKVNSTNRDIKISWDLIENAHEGNMQFLSELKIVNNGTNQLGDDWELFFSFSPCRALSLGEDNKDLDVEHIEGDYHRIQPSSSFAGLKGGDTLKLKLLGSSWVIKPNDAPGGFYFIFDNRDDAIYHPEYIAGSFYKDEHIQRTTGDQIAAPSAQSRFEKNQRIELLEKNSLSVITPTPVYYQPTNKFFEFKENTNLVFDPSLKSEADLLVKEMKDCYDILLSTSNESSGDIELKIQAVNQNNLTWADAESYEIRIEEDKVIISANTSKGIFYGTQSFQQIVGFNQLESPDGTVRIPGAIVRDSPRFGYRGMHMDIARNFLPKEAVLRLLDLMGMYKLNKFHFHFSDDEGWRLEIPGLEELTSVGSNRGHTRDERDRLFPQYGSGSNANGESNGGSGYYTREDFIEILKHASQRHIEVIPEIDMPGHARAAIKSMESRYRRLLEEGDEEEAQRYLLTDFSDTSHYSSVQQFSDNVICVCRESAYGFLEKVVDEIIDMYREAEAPLTTIHTGGDEVPHGVWEGSSICQQLMADNGNIESPVELKYYFLDRFSEIIKSKGLRTGGWEEIGLHLEADHAGAEVKTVNPGFADRDFQIYIWNSVYGWGGEEIGYKLANAGYQVVLCNVTHLYFDMAYDKDPEEPGFYWGGFVTDEEPFLFEPLDLYRSLSKDGNGVPIPKEAFANSTYLTEKGKENILGIQGQLWSETVKTKSRMEYMVMPRLLTLAERAWAQPPQWDEDEDSYLSAWSEMANRMGQIDLPRVEEIYEDLNFRIPLPGGDIRDGLLKANIELPGFEIRYTIDGSEPSASSTLYTDPVSVSSSVKMAAFTPKGRKGRTVELAYTANLD